MIGQPSIRSSIQAQNGFETADRFHDVVFSSACRDRVGVPGSRRGMKMPYWIYWIKTATQRHHKSHWIKNTSKGSLGPHQVYARISRDLRSSFERAPKCAEEKCAGQYQTLLDYVLINGLSHFSMLGS